jgi:hypothetical protein
MLEQWDSILLGLLIILIIFSILIGKDQMIRVIIGNYILMIVWLSFAWAVDMWNWSNQTFSLTDSRDIWSLLSDGRITITLIVYALLLLLIFKKSTLHSSHPWLLDKWFMLFLVPMTVLSLALTLGVIFLWTEVFDPQAMAKYAVNLSYDPSIQSIITRTPLWMFLHSLLTVLLTTHVSLNYFTRKSAPPPDVFE